MNQEVYILAAVRTPLGSFGGKLSGLTATELGSIATCCPPIWAKHLRVKRPSAPVLATKCPVPPSIKFVHPA